MERPKETSLDETTAVERQDPEADEVGFEALGLDHDEEAGDADEEEGDDDHD